ncbi:GDP dissociation inhibitor-like protein [Elsinoe fawcettii]|nr:GDP dissociation inhibitor-like protein [Elsinoe fawcettii]
MDTLDGTSWDVVIAGTGLQSALLALALSRSNKKILHLDKNDYYGGREAALSISEIESWIEKHKLYGASSSFANASISRPDVEVNGPVRLASPRAYSLSLSPCLLYTRSSLIPALVASKSHEQLEFLAVGSWFVFQPSSSSESTPAATTGKLVQVPNSREDIFSNSDLSLRAKGALVKFLRFAAVYQDQESKEIWEDWKDKPFADFLVTKFKIAAEFHGPLLALSMSSKPNAEVMTDFALFSIHRHLTSMGVFGAGFAAVLPKYGGLSEVVQVACRAAAVGGTVYVLNRGIEEVGKSTESDQRINLVLSGGDKVTTNHLCGTSDQLPLMPEPALHEQKPRLCSRSISIISSRLSTLFPRSGEGSPPPSAAVVVFPSASLGTGMADAGNQYPVHLFIHAADTGECPVGQCVVYGFTSESLQNGSAHLEAALSRLLESTPEDPRPQVLWSLKHEVRSPAEGAEVASDAKETAMYRFVESADGPVFDDQVIESVKQAWQSISGETEDAFMRFVDRNAGEDGGDPDGVAQE